MLEQADDVMFLKYHELRVTQRESRRHSTRSRSSRNGAREREAAFGGRPRLWAGTITHWSLHEEPYKQGYWDWPGIYERSKEAATAAIGNAHGSGASAGVVEGTGAGRRLGRAIRSGEEGRAAGLQDDESIMGRALHEDRRSRHRLGRRAFSPGGRVARVRHSRRRRHTNGDASHQNRSARAAERSVWSC